MRILAEDLRGPLELCINGRWATICRDGWTSTDATVVCRELGYSDGKTFSYTYPILAPCIALYYMHMCVIKSTINTDNSLMQLDPPHFAHQYTWWWCGMGSQLPALKLSKAMYNDTERNS